MQPMNEVISEQTPSQGLEPGKAAEQSDQKTRMLGLLSTLPENQREVVRLKFQNGMSYKEIASVTEQTVSNVGFLLHTAIQSLRVHMTAAGE